jgi:hypothetical protein
MRKYVLFALLVAAPALGQSQATDLRTAAGCGPSKIQFDVKTDKKQHTLTQPESGTALVFVIEEETSDQNYLQIGHSTTRIGLDGNWVGANHGNSYASFAVRPGNHRVCSDVQSIVVKNLSGAADLVAEAGKTYYYRVEVWDGDHERPPQVRVKAVDESEGLLLISKSAYSTWKAKN